jgi:hypothetical protein
MINYIVACYFGPRRVKNSNYLNDRFYFIKQHINKINLYNDKNISKVTFVVNPFDQRDKEIELLVKDLNYQYEIIYKSTNDNYSYGCWNEAIVKNINENYDYFMLMEDDYSPSIENYTNYFLNCFDSNTCCVVQWNTINNSFSESHAAISNGLISAEKCKHIYFKYNKVFCLWSLKQNEYSIGEWNQIHFLDLFKKENYDIKDISSISRNIFQNINNVLVCTGNEKGIDVLHPII